MGPFEKLIADAKMIATADDIRAVANVRDLARDFVDILGEDAPCGFDPPLQVEHNGVKSLLVNEEFTSRDEARAYAAMLLRAADEHWPER